MLSEAWSFGVEILKEEVIALSKRLEAFQKTKKKFWCYDVETFSQLYYDFNWQFHNSVPMDIPIYDNTSELSTAGTINF